MKNFKNLFGMFASGGLGILGASSLFGVAHAATLDPVASVATGAGGVEGLGGAAVVGVLAWLLQQSTRERVSEAKEYGENAKRLQDGHIQMVIGLMNTETNRADRLLTLLEQQVTKQR